LSAPTPRGRRTKASVETQAAAAAGHPNDPKLGAKELFGRKILPAAMPTRVVGFLRQRAA